jgi:hypothetical protein
MHVCKDHDHFITFKPYFKPILHGDSSSDIAGIGTVVLKVDTMVGLQSVKLYNVAYVLGFHFNLVSALKLKQLGYYMDGINKRLINQQGYIIAFLYPLNDMYFMENPTPYNSAMATIKSIKQRVTKVSLNVWHRRLSHTGKEALLYLPEASIGVELITTKFNYDGDLCNMCVKRSYPFEKLHFDLIYLHKAFNADYYLLHFYCPFCGFYINYTLTDKSEDSFIQLTDHILTLTAQWGYIIQFF